MGKSNLRVLDRAAVLSLTAQREGEAKIGQQIPLLASRAERDFSRSLKLAYGKGARFAVLGLPEDIGPRANGGRAGADKGWQAFLNSFVNLQANDFLPLAELVLVGHVDFTDLQKKTRRSGRVTQLRELCELVDQRVSPIISSIVSAGLTPIVIGGGHNNSLPIIRGVSAAIKGTKKQLACVNVDAHADFRRLEGRHSGNGFSYAHAAKILGAYYVFGAHESYNSKEMLRRLVKAGFRYKTFEEACVRGSATLRSALRDVVRYVTKTGLRIGLEFDVDSIANMPSSACNPLGFTLAEASSIMHHLVKGIKRPAYLHLAEGAPPLGVDGERTVGRSLAQLVCTFVKACRA